VASIFSAASAHATVYDVGPGQPLANVGDVPWESLAAGDTVQIHWRATPYREKWVISRAGTAAQPITVRGIADGQFIGKPTKTGCGRCSYASICDEVVN